MVRNANGTSSRFFYFGVSRLLPGFLSAIGIVSFAVLFVRKEHFRETNNFNRPSRVIWFRPSQNGLLSCGILRNFCRLLGNFWILRDFSGRGVRLQVCGNWEVARKLLEFAKLARPEEEVQEQGLSLP